MPVTLTIPQVIARLQREMAGDKLVMRICDELSRHREKTLRAAITAISYTESVADAIAILEDMRENSNAVR